ARQLPPARHREGDVPARDRNVLTELADLAGSWRAHPSARDLAEAFVAPEFDDRGWPELAVPGHWRSAPEFAADDGPLLYRRRIAVEPPAPGRRRMLVFDGVFYYADVWFDGSYLGASEGYFTPHVFEITDHRAREHTLAVEVACPPQHDHTAKQLVTGVFSHWDNLDPEWNPGGLWRPVRVVETGPVRLARARVLCTEASATRGRLRLDLTLDAAPWSASTPLPACLTVTVHGPGPTETRLADARRDVTLAAGANELSWVVDVDDPPIWWSWRLGDQPRCALRIGVDVGGEESDSHDVTTAFREVRMRNWHLTVNGERLFVLGSNQGPTRMQLAEATAEEFRRDVQLAKDANLDLLRMHAHVSRPEMYEAADEAGLLIWQDFPLQWGYARGVRREAVRQARAMVDLLGHRPSIAFWCAHNEPLAVAMRPGEPIEPRQLAQLGASMLLPSWNKDVLDFSITRALRRADPTRFVNPHSGLFPGLGQSGTDSHFYFGWYHGRMDGLAPALAAVPRVARFVSEFGAQAVPDTNDFMEPDRWPDLDWETLFERHACQKRVFNRHVPPSAFETFDEWRIATQAYQATLIQLQIEDLRRIQWNPTGGFCHFCFADGHPAVTWSVLDNERAPKLGYAALRDACRAVLPMLEPRQGLVHVASQRRAPLPDATVTVQLGTRTWRFAGDVAANDVTYVGALDRSGVRALRRAAGATVTLT
ncbi:MAG: glycoside hydrolase family 2 protein, partial [Acidimicrobiia bacterium]